MTPRKQRSIKSRVKNAATHQIYTCRVIHSHKNGNDGYEASAYAFAGRAKPSRIFRAGLLNSLILEAVIGGDAESGGGTYKLINTSASAG